MPEENSAELVESAAGQYAVRGDLSFSTVAGLLKRSASLFAQPQVAIDLAGVTYADSAGLALLIEWLRLARQRGVALRYSGLPAQLRSLAAVSEVEALLA